MASEWKFKNSNGKYVTITNPDSNNEDITVDLSDIAKDTDLLAGLAIAQPAGAVITFASSTAPNGYLKCNGALVSRTTYAALFAAIGTTFGAGDGSTTFKLPDLRGYFVRGWDDSRGVDTGRTLGTTQEDELKSHSHTTSVYHTNIGGIYYGGTGGNMGATSGTNATGGTETRPKNIALLYCIKY